MEDKIKQQKKHSLKDFRELGSVLTNILPGLLQISLFPQGCFTAEMTTSDTTYSCKVTGDQGVCTSAPFCNFVEVENIHF